MKTMTRYMEVLNQMDIKLDPAQLSILEHLTTLEDNIIKRSKIPALIKNYKKNRIRGIYMWGNVGRGKTFLLDLFFRLLNIKRKKRIHFQRFMQKIHNDLFTLSGKEQPLEKIATELSKECDIICLDEFYIDDIASAMILGNLLKLLYKKGVVLVMTSNLHPDELYLSGLQRDLFLPTIEKLKSKQSILSLEKGTDYRLTSKPSHHIFFLGPNKKIDLTTYYKKLTSKTDPASGTININTRLFTFKAQQEAVIWFDFQELCEKPRSYYDYIYLAKNFHTLLISNIPQLDNGNCEDHYQFIFNTNRTRRFISLIDEIYDRSVNLIASFEKELDQIYLGTELDFQFNRTYSRLIEMQTKGYMTVQHKP